MNPTEQAQAQQLFALLTKIGDLMGAAIAKGADQKEIFTATRELLAGRLNVPPLQAANLARLALNELTLKATGGALYSRADMATVINRAFA